MLFAGSNSRATQWADPECVLRLNLPLQVIAQVVEAPRAPDDFAVINEKGEPPTVEQLQAQLASL